MRVPEEIAPLVSLAVFLSRVCAVALSATPGLAQGLDSAPQASPRFFSSAPNPPSGWSSLVLRDNGGFVNGVGNGFGGADTSIIEGGYNTYGYSHSVASGFRVADDFTVPIGATWTLSTLKWYAYQTNSTTTSTLTSINVRIWSGSPAAGGSVLAGDTTTDRLISSQFTNVYRVLSSAPLSNLRPIMECAVDMSWAPVLAPGTYFLDVQATGSLSSGPNANPKVPRVVGDNALQFSPISPPSGAWVPLADGLSVLQQDLPYKLEGSALIDPIVYCTAKLNGLGCTPAINFTGVASATSGSGFLVQSINNRNNKSGLLFYGVSGQMAVPFQGGTLCVSAPIKRSPVVGSGGSPQPANDCSGVYSIDMNLFAVGGLGGTPLALLQVEGTAVNCQFWGRDPGFPAPDNTSLSDALQYVVGP